MLECPAERSVALNVVGAHELGRSASIRIPGMRGRIGASMPFRVSPVQFIRGDERDHAISSLASYFTSGRFTGRKFEEYADFEVPNAFTSLDLLAVTMLSVSIPAAVGIWLLEDGAARIKELLADIPPAARPWSDPALLNPGSAGWELWDLVRKQPGLGRTKTSKLLAVKRPNMFPIYDQHVGRALLASGADSDWAAWAQCFEGHKGVDLAKECELLRHEAGVGADVSALRVLDVVIWMRVHGDIELSKRDRFWE